MNLKYVFLVLIFGFFGVAMAQSWDFKDTSFKSADSLAFINKEASLKDMPQLVYNLTNGLETDVERFRAIYLWVCNNIKNDYALYAKNKRKRKKYSEDSLKLEAWNAKFRKKIFNTLRKRKRTICTGYAYTIKIMSDLADINCEIVNGFGKASSGNPDDLRYPNHSWNAVKLNNKWYLCDPTWSSGFQNPKTGKFEFGYNDGLFLASPELFSINHFPIEARWFLTENKPTFQEFLNAPIVYNDAYTVLEKFFSPQNFYNRVLENHTAKINFSLLPNDRTEQHNYVLQIDNGYNTKTITPDIEVTERKLQLSHKLEKVGLYDIHLRIDDLLVATFVYEVYKKE